MRSKRFFSFLPIMLISAFFLCQTVFADGEAVVAGDSDPLLGKKLIAAALIVFAGAFLLVRRRKNNSEPKEPQPKKQKAQKAKKSKADASIPVPPAPQVNPQSTPALSMNKTVYMGGSNSIPTNKTVYMGNPNQYPPQNNAAVPKMTFSLRDMSSGMLYEAIVPCKNDFVTSASHYEARIGRANDNDIVIDVNQTISAHHCRVVFNESVAQVFDLQSKNGTSVDGSPVTGSDPRVINNGSTLRMGEVSFQFEYRNQPESFSSPTLW